LTELPSDTTRSKARRYRPDAAPSPRKLSQRMKGILLYLMPAPLLIAAIATLVSANLYEALIASGAFAAYILAASLARHGFRIEQEYQRRKIARAPRTPFKTIAGVLTGITTGALAWLGADYNIIGATAIGGAAFLGFAFYYGLDPRRDKTEGITIGVTVEEVIEALEEAELSIEAIDEARKSIGNAEYSTRLRRITDKARQILSSIEADPSRLSSARKFLKVYLDGARRVTEGYARSQATEQAVPEALETDFNRVLDSIEQTFNEQQTQLLENNTFDLDVQISVLEQQLKRENAF